MKAKKKILLIVFLFIILLSSVNVFAIEVKTEEYSKRYEEWLQLSEEEKENTIAPLPFNIRGEKQGIFSKIKTMVKSISLPNKYDLREHIDIERKNQEKTGECWIFSANSALETHLALNNEKYEFSERHGDYETTLTFLDGENKNGLKRELGSGGETETAFIYYSRGNGPIAEEYMPFENNENKIYLHELPTGVEEKKVDDMIYFPSIYKIRENNTITCVDANYNEYSNAEVKAIRNQIKEHIMNYGGVVTSIHAPGEFFNEETNADNIIELKYGIDHDVTIIGWDDNYSKENFINKPTEDGAYIVLNSWGKEWGENGIYYISYEDCYVESTIKGVRSISDIQYDNLYQHDTSGILGGLLEKFVYAANVFKCEEDEVLKEIMIGTVTEQTFNIYVNPTSNDLNINNLTKIASNVKVLPGYNTIEIKDGIKFKKGNEFAIIVERIGEGIGIGMEWNDSRTFSNVKSNANESYASVDGVNWADIYNENDMMNFSIKAYTKADKKSFEVSEISGKAYTNATQLSFSVETSYEKAGEKVNVSIFKDNIDVTKDFNIYGNEIKGKGAFINIESLNNLEKGKYKISVSMNGFNAVNKEFTVVDLPSNMTVIEFKDGNFAKYCKGILEGSILIQKDENYKLIAPKTTVENIEKLEIISTKIEDLTGIESFENLKQLTIQETKVTDFSKITELKKLENLCLYENNLEDISVILNNKNLNSIAVLEQKNNLNEVINAMGETIEIPNIINQLVEKESNLQYYSNIVYDIKLVDGTYTINSIEGFSKQEIKVENNKRVTTIDNEITKEHPNKTRGIVIGFENDRVEMQYILFYNVKRDLKEIKIKNLPTKNTYSKGEELDLTGGILEVKYTDNSTEDIEMTNQQVEVSGYDKEKLGKQTITLTYGGLKVNFDIEVIEDYLEIKEFEEVKDSQITYLENIYENTTIKTLKANIETNGVVEIYNKGEKVEDDSTKLATGMIIKITLNSEVKSYTIVVTGDINGDGKVTNSDLFLLARYRAGFEKEKEMVKNEFLRATDIVKDGKYTNGDLFKLARILVNLDVFVKEEK